MDYFSIIDNILTSNINNYLYIEDLYNNFLKKVLKKDIYSKLNIEYLFLLHVITYNNTNYDLKIIKGTNNIVYIGLFEFDYKEDVKDDEN